MKKIAIIILLFFVSLIIITFNKQEEKNIQKSSYEMKAVFISYLEYEEIIRNDINNSKENVKKMIENIKSLNLNTIILHVRSFSDSIYKSSIFPCSYTLTGTEGKCLDYDLLDFFITTCHKNNISIHAWINPYRIRSNNDISTISKSNPAYKYLNTDSVKVLDDGIYYNPSSNLVNNLIIEEIKELINNYDIDGVHFDDYFYPSKDIDLNNYEEYVFNNGEMTIEQYRYNVILNMIKNVYSIIKEKNKTILFGISPAGNIENNYNNEYLDIKELLSKDYYIDYIMPQIYYGFDNSTKPFIKTIDEWNNLIKSNIKLIPALAFYKTGKKDNYAKNGVNEWKNNSDIITRQIEYSRKLSNYNGFSLFRYSSVFNNNNETANKEKNNLLDLLK